MDDEKQGDAPPPPSDTHGAHDPAPWYERAIEPGVPPHDQRVELPADPERSLGYGLAGWLAALTIFGVGGLFMGMQEMAVLVAFAGMFVTAQAADLDSRWKSLYHSLSWVVPIGGAGFGLEVAFLLQQGDMVGAPRVILMAIALWAAAISLLTLYRPFSNALTRMLFRGSTPSHTLRLGARIILLALLLVVPGWFAFRSFIEHLIDDPAGLLEHVSLGGELIGYGLLALAAVGFMIRRGVRDTLTRLGILPLARDHLAIAAIGVVALFGLNTGADHIQRLFFHELWLSDQEMNRAIASGLGTSRVIMLGLSAGIGEEITMRGALQPKLGLVLTSLLFATLHVQYSWFGMLVIFLLGLVLGTIRQRTSTSVAMIVHAAYDVLAIWSM